MPRFVIWGRIAGEPVPEMTVGQLRTTNTVPADFESLSTQAGVERLRASVNGAPSSVTAHRVDIAAQSDHFFWIRLDAPDGDIATKVAIRDHLTPFVAALVAHTGEPYYAQAIWASRLDQHGRILQSVGVPIERTTAMYFESRPDVPAEPIVAVASALQEDRHARQAAGYLVEGLRMKFRATTEADGGAAILQLHLCIETLARTVYGKHDEVALLARQQEVVVHLRETLARAGTTSQSTKAIKNASTSLDREQLRFLSDQIKRLGEDLSLDPIVIEDAVQVAAFRNRAIGHASAATISGAEWGRWGDRAFSASAAFLRAYCQRMAVGHSQPR